MAEGRTSLSPTVDARLDELVAALQTGLGDTLVGVIMHGSAVRGGWREATSDVDLVCVLKTDALATLSGIGPALELARLSARIETMIVTENEISEAADCFPLLYGDIARGSVALCGKNPFTGMHIEAAHRRLRIEQELREIRIRLRRVASDMSREPQFGGAVERKVKQSRAALWALLSLRGEKHDEGLESVLDASCAVYAVDHAALRRTREAPGEAYEALCKLLDAALADVNARDGHEATTGASA